MGLDSGTPRTSLKSLSMVRTNVVFCLRGPGKCTSTRRFRHWKRRRPSSGGVKENARTKEAWSTYSENTRRTEVSEKCTVSFSGAENSMVGGVRSAGPPVGSSGSAHPQVARIRRAGIRGLCNPSDGTPGKKPGTRSPNVFLHLATAVRALTSQVEEKECRKGTGGGEYDGLQIAARPGGAW